MTEIDLTTFVQKSPHQRALFFTKEGKIVVENDSPFLSVATTWNRLGMPLCTAYQKEDVFIVHLHEEEIPGDSEIKLISPRDCFLSLQDQPEIENILLQASHWIISQGMLQCCSCCGASLEKILETTEKKCTHCHSSFFPKLSPAVLVSIERGEEILLGRSPQHPEGMYTVLAGFIDLGESAEQAVHREVKEEVGLEVANLKYFGTQSWPFPDSFMIAFQADYCSGEIQIDPQELEEARWFDRDQLPLLPPPSTLSRKLIEDFLRRTKK